MMLKKLFVFVVLYYILGFFAGCTNSQRYLTNKNNWPVYQGNKSSSHYSLLDQIDTDNVKELKVAWIYRTGDANSATQSEIECNPIEIDGTLYGTSPELKLFALNAASGKPKWVFNPFANTSMTHIQINFNRAVTYWSHGRDKRIFYAAGSYLYAVNAQTGRLVTSFGNLGKVNLHDGLGPDVGKLYVTATSPGIIYKDLLIMGTRVAETNPAAPGDIRAYDVNTGKIQWIFHTIPHPGEVGYDTWEDKNAWKHTGGANCWAGMSLDEKRGIVYVPTGSATFDFYGGLRKGKDLFSDCLIALNASNGKLIWYYQTIHHDLWDRDLPSPPNLVTIDHGGKKVDAVAQVTKTGYVFIFNRVTGKPLFPIKEEQVPDTPALPGEQPWPTQPVPQIPKPFMEQQFTINDINNLVPDSSQAVVRKELMQLQPETYTLEPPSERGTVIFPGFDGGAEWGGASFDPTTDLLYINANQVPWSLTMAKNNSMKAISGQTIAKHGEAIYMTNCIACHGANREGGGSYPSLININKVLSENQVLNIVSNGLGMMPAFTQIPEDDKRALVSFLLDLKNGNQPFISQSGSNKSPNLMPYTMTGYKKIRTPEGYPANKPPWGTLTAINLNTGKTIWQIPLGEYPELIKKGFPTTGTENYGGAVVTAGGLLFIAATSDNKIRAFNKRTGKLLWEAELPASGFATPSTYQIDGKQYVVIACGGGKLNTPSGDAYVAFALP